MPGETISFRLSPQTREQLERLATKRDMTRTAVIELAVKQLAEQKAPPIDRARIEEAIESLCALKAGAKKARIGA